MSIAWWEEGLRITTRPIEMLKCKWWWWLPFMPERAWEWFPIRKTFPAGTVVTVCAFRTNSSVFPEPHDAVLRINGHAWHTGLPRWYRKGDTDEYRKLAPLEELAHGAFADD